MSSSSPCGRVASKAAGPAGETPPGPACRYRRTVVEPIQARAPFRLTAWIR
jgi:hypothetical protein